MNTTKKVLDKMLKFHYFMRLRTFRWWYIHITQGVHTFFIGSCSNFEYSLFVFFFNEYYKEKLIKVFIILICFGT